MTVVDVAVRLNFKQPLGNFGVMSAVNTRKSSVHTSETSMLFSHETRCYPLEATLLRVVEKKVAAR